MRDCKHKSASKVTTEWRYRNFIIIIIISNKAHICAQYVIITITCG